MACIITAVVVVFLIIIGLLFAAMSSFEDATHAGEPYIYPPPDDDVDCHVGYTMGVNQAKNSDMETEEEG